MTRCRFILVVLILVISPFLLMSNVPISISMSAQLADADGNLINGSNDTTITLKNANDDVLWSKTYIGMIFSNGSIDFEIQGEDDSETPLTALLFDDDGVVMEISTNLVTGTISSDPIAISSQPYALISAIAKDTQKIGGTTIATTTPSSGDLLNFDGTDWAPIDLSSIIIPSENSEVSGPLDQLSVKKILGKAIITSEKNGSQIPTGAVLMYDPQMDNLMGAFHPSSGAPNDKDVLVWNSSNRIWEPSPVSDGSSDMVFGRLTIGNISSSNSNITLLVEKDMFVDGNGYFGGAIHISGGADLAEAFHITGESVEPGTVLSIDPNEIGKLMTSKVAYDKKVAGVVSGANGIQPGLIMAQSGTLADGEVPVALTGRVWVKCVNTNGDISVGDLLTTASKPGHAMKSNLNQQGSILGKAMSTCGENGLVLTLISLQ